MGEPTKEFDRQVELALLAIRTHDYEGITTSVSSMYAISGTSLGSTPASQARSTRVVVMCMLVEGNLAFLKRQYSIAFDYHTDVVNTWRRLGIKTEDERWQRDNRFHLFRAQAAKGSTRAERLDNYDAILDDAGENDPMRILRVRLFQYLGRIWLPFDRFIDRW